MIELSTLLPTAPVAPGRPQLLAAASVESFAVALSALVLPGTPGDVAVDGKPVPGKPVVAARQGSADPGKDLPLVAGEIEASADQPLFEGDAVDPAADGDPKLDPALAWLPQDVLPVEPTTVPAIVAPVAPQPVVVAAAVADVAEPVLAPEAAVDGEAAPTPVSQPVDAVAAPATEKLPKATPSDAPQAPIPETRVRRGRQSVANAAVPTKRAASADIAPVQRKGNARHAAPPQPVVDAPAAVAQADPFPTAPQPEPASQATPAQATPAPIAVTQADAPRPSSSPVIDGQPAPVTGSGAVTSQPLAAPAASSAIEVEPAPVIKDQSVPAAKGDPATIVTPAIQQAVAEQIAAAPSALPNTPAPQPASPTVANQSVPAPSTATQQPTAEQITAALRPVVLSAPTAPQSAGEVRAAHAAAPAPAFGAPSQLNMPASAATHAAAGSASALFQLALEPAPRRFRPAEAASLTLLAPARDMTAPLIPLAAAAGDQQPMLDTRRQEWTGQMIDMIEAMQDEAPVKETKMRLAPEALGNVEITVRRDGDRVHVHFAADTPTARQMLADAQPRLAEIAEQRGLKLGQTSVDGGAAGQGHNSQRQEGEGRQPGRPASARSRADTERKPTATDERIA